MGLGLAIVRGLVELHDGTVEAASEGRDAGAEFTVRLPRSARAPLQSGALRPPAEPTHLRAAKGRVLVVDDNHDAADLLCDLLTTLGYETRVAYDGPSAIEQADIFAPDLALVDIRLPVMDGYEVAQRLAAEARGRPITLVAVTGYGQQRDREASESAGFSAHLVKPVDAEQLRDVVARLIRDRPIPGRAEGR